MNPVVTRRAFLKSTTAASALAFPAVLRSQAPGTASPNNRLNVAIIGVGGRGGAALSGLRDENIVALCDVDEERANAGLKSFSGQYQAESERSSRAKRFTDYRKMFDQLGNSIDAVTVSIPDHAHFAVAMTAMGLGKHVYVEKPASHNIWEGRKMIEAGRKYKRRVQVGHDIRSVARHDVERHQVGPAAFTDEPVTAGAATDQEFPHHWTVLLWWPTRVSRSSQDS